MPFLTRACRSGVDPQNQTGAIVPVAKSMASRLRRRIPCRRKCNRLEDRELFWFAETVQEIWDGILHWYDAFGGPLRLKA